MSSFRQQLVAVSVAAGLCGAAVATGVLVILQTAGLHAACSIGSMNGGDSLVETAGSATSRAANLPPEDPRRPA